MRVVPYVEWDQCDTGLVLGALSRHSVRMKGHPFWSDDSLGITLGRLRRGELRAAIMDAYLLIYDVGPAWCSEQPLLYEYLLIRITAGGSFEDAIAGMRYIADANGCTGLITGNGVLRPGLRKLYERAGAVKHGETYFLGV